MPKNSRIKQAKFKAQQSKQQPIMVTQQEQLQAIMDLVMRTLFNNADMSGMRLKEDIFDPLRIEVPAKEADKIWDVLTNSGLVSPLVGFGNAGKLELTSEGIKMMAEYGGYKDFIEARHARQMEQRQAPANNNDTHSPAAKKQNPEP